MAFLFLFGSLIILVPTLIYLFFRIIISLSPNSSDTHKNTYPPGKKGWPLIGESLSFASCPEKFVQDRMTKHSPEIFQTSIAGQSVAVLCGPTANKFVFTNDNKTIKPWWSKIITKSLACKSSGPSSAIFLNDHSFLKLESIRNYVPVMDSSTRNHMEKCWVPYDNVKALNLAKKLTFSLACKLFIDYNDAQVNDLAEPFFTIVRGIVSAPVNVPGTAYYAAMKGGAIVREKLVNIIKQRKLELAEGGTRNDHPDLLTKLLFSVDNDGRFFSQDEIASKIIGYLIASFVTTSNAITYVLSFLAEYPHVYEKVFKEQQEIAKCLKAEELLTWSDIKKMKYSWNVVCESLRLMSPSPGTLKEVLTPDLTFMGFNIPRGWKVMWTPYSTNKDPRYFPNPEDFDPSRFEGRGPQPYTFVPFGGGPHMCSGNEYARIHILVFVHNVVIKFKLKKMNPNEKIIYTPDPTPAEGLPLYLQKL